MDSIEENLFEPFIANKYRLKALVTQFIFIDTIQLHYLKFNNKSISSKNFIKELYELLGNNSMVIMVILKCLIVVFFRLAS